MFLLRGESQLPFQHLAHPLRSLGQDLERMPPRHGHHAADGFDIFVGHAVLKQIAHGIDEYELGRAPGERLRQFLRDKTKIETLFVGMTFHSTKALGERFGIAVLAPGTDLGAAANGIPSGVGPFDMGVE